MRLTAETTVALCPPRVARFTHLDGTSLGYSSPLTYLTDRPAQLVRLYAVQTASVGAAQLLRASAIEIRFGSDLPTSDAWCTNDRSLGSVGGGVPVWM